MAEEKIENIKPNYVMFMPHQLRYDCLGAFGNKVIKTSNIDSLDLNGTKFANCFYKTVSAVKADFRFLVQDTRTRLRKED